MRLKLSYQAIMHWLILFAVFLPNNLHIAGVLSFRIPIILCLIFLFFINKFTLEVKGIIKNPFLWLYFIYAGIRYSLAGALTSGIGIIVDSIVLMYCAIESIRDEYDLRSFCKLFCNFVNIYCVLGILEFLTGFNLWASLTNTELVGTRYGFHRIYGSFENYMNNGTFLVLALVFVIWSIQNINKKKYIFTYILILLNIFFTLTRASIIGLVILNLICMIKAGLFNLMKKHFALIIFGGLVIILIFQIPQVKTTSQAIRDMFIAVFDSSVANEISSEFGGNAVGTGQRLDLYEWVWKSISNKWMGAGPTTPFAYKWVTSTGTIALKWSIENHGLYVLYKFGLSGLALYIIMMLSVVFDTIKAGRLEKKIISYNSKARFSLSFLVTTAVIVYLLMGFFHAYLSDFRFFILMIGILSGYVSSSYITQSKHKKTD